MKKMQLAIIGSGNMGTSLMGGLIADGYPSENITISDVNEEKLQLLQHQFGVNTTTSNQEAITNAEVIIFAIKPQVFQQIATELAPQIQTKKPLIISIAAGIKEESIQAWLGKNIPIVRTMPNTPALIGCGASALYANQFVNEEQHDVAESMLRAVGLVVWLDDEKLMDVVTALSGSGPAYFFLIMEILQKGAEDLGLPKEISRLLTLQTAFGAARMALESPDNVSVLRERVTSPGGTTESALNVLKEKKLNDILSSALSAAKNRSEELANILGSTDPRR